MCVRSCFTSTLRMDSNVNAENERFSVMASFSSYSRAAAASWHSQCFYDCERLYVIRPQTAPIDEVTEWSGVHSHRFDRIQRNIVPLFRQVRSVAGKSFVISLRDARAATEKRNWTKPRERKARTHRWPRVRIRKVHSCFMLRALDSHRTICMESQCALNELSVHTTALFSSHRARFLLCPVSFARCLVASLPRCLVASTISTIAWFILWIEYSIAMANKVNPPHAFMFAQQQTE